MYVCICVRVCIHMYICICVYVYVSIYVYTYVEYVNGKFDMKYKPICSGDTTEP